MNGEEDPCDVEPCRSLLDSYWQEIAKLYGEKAKVQAICTRLRFVRHTLRDLLVLWVVLLLAALMCSSQFLPPLGAICQTLWAGVAVVTAAIAALTIVHWILTQALAAASAACFNQGVVVLRLIARINAACPPQCRVPALVLSCNCE